MNKLTKAKSKPIRKNFSDFKYLRKVLIKTHNRNVRKVYKDVKNVDLTNGRSAANIACLIVPKDGILILLVRLFLFYIVFGHLDKITAIATIPESWQVKTEKDRPQLVIVYRNKVSGKKKPSTYQLVIPHYNGDKTPSALNYDKGSRVGSWYMKDNSYLRVNCKTDEECERVLKALSKHVKKGYLVGEPLIGQRKGKPLKEVEVYPVRADYYSKGRENMSPDWRYYFKEE